MADQDAALEKRKALPIFCCRNGLLELIEEQQVLVIAGEAGSGKTSQVPQYLYEAGYRKIACTQPSEFAAMSAAARVSREMGTILGDQVGYYSFGDCSSEQTILYMTDGTLLRELLGDPDLAGYSVVMVDEAHERTLNTDILLALMKVILRSRPDLKLLISSASLNAKNFCDYFDGAPVFKIPGRKFPFEISYILTDLPDVFKTIVETTSDIHKNQSPGGILIYLADQEDIEEVENLLSATLGSELVISKLHPNLPFQLLSKIFQSTGRARKVVLATNIAETALVVDAIRYVIDPGSWMTKTYNASTGTEYLTERPISKASAMHRAGRSCRLGTGKCFRLYSERDFLREFEDDTVPEILRTNLIDVILFLKCLRVCDWVNTEAAEDVEVEDWIQVSLIDPPSRRASSKAIGFLRALGALGSSEELTRQGRQIAEFPLDPMLAKMIIDSEKYGCSYEILTIAAILSTGSSILYRPSVDNEGDHITLLKVYSSWEAENYSIRWLHENYVHVGTMERAKKMRDRLERILERVGITISSNSNRVAITKCILSGFFSHAAEQNNGFYRIIGGSQVFQLHPWSGLAQVLPKFVVYHDLEAKFNTYAYAKHAIEIVPEWLVEVAPLYYKLEEGKIIAIPRDSAK